MAFMASVDEIYGQMMADFTQETGVDLRDSCDLAVRFHAVAAQVVGLYHQLDWVVEQCFPQTASGVQLDYHATLRGLSRKEGASAVGILRFYVSEGQTVERTVPAGTVAMTAGLIRFVTIQEGVIPVGSSYVDVAAQAEESGSQGNVASLAVVAMATAPVGVSQCVNLTAFTGGSDWEDDGGLRSRILASYSTLPNGVNVAYYRQEALEFEGVVAVAVLPCLRGVGTVDIVVAVEGGIPDDSLVSALSDYFEERREIAVSLLVREPDEVEVDLSAQISVKSGYDEDEVQQAVEDRLTAWFGGEGLGRSVLIAQLSSLIFACDGVENCKILTPTADVDIEADDLTLLDSLTIEVV